MTLPETAPETAPDTDLPTLFTLRRELLAQQSDLARRLAQVQLLCGLVNELTDAGVTVYSVVTRGGATVNLSFDLIPVSGAEADADRPQLMVDKRVVDALIERATAEADTGAFPDGTDGTEDDPHLQAAAARPAPEAPATVPQEVTGPFSEAENARILSMHDAGHPKAVIAQSLGRATNVLALHLARLLRARGAPEAAIDPKPQPQPVPEDAPEPEPAATPIASQPLQDVPEDLRSHLALLPRKRGWTIRRDHDLLHFATLGWKLPEISVELQVAGKELAERFDIITANKRWKRDDCLAALAAMLAAQAA